MTYRQLPYFQKEELDTFIRDYFLTRQSYQTNEDKDKFWNLFTSAVEKLEEMDEYEYGYWHKRDNNLKWLFDEVSGWNEMERQRIKQIENNPSAYDIERQCEYWRKQAEEEKKKKKK